VIPKARWFRPAGFLFAEPNIDDAVAGVTISM
jgi:hypothetical protein